MPTRAPPVEPDPEKLVRAGEALDLGQSARMVFDSDSVGSMGRARKRLGYDWHAWHLLVAMIPGALAFAFARSIERGGEREEWEKNMKARMNAASDGNNGVVDPFSARGWRRDEDAPGDKREVAGSNPGGGGPVGVDELRAKLDEVRAALPVLEEELRRREENFEKTSKDGEVAEDAEEEAAGIEAEKAAVEKAEPPSTSTSSSASSSNASFLRVVHDGLRRGGERAKAPIKRFVDAAKEGGERAVKGPIKRFVDAAKVGTTRFVKGVARLVGPRRFDGEGRAKTAAEKEAARAAKERARAEREKESESPRERAAVEKAEKAAMIEAEKKAKAEKLALEKAAKAEKLALEKAAKAEKLALEKAAKAEKLALEKAAKAEKLALEKADKERAKAAAKAAATKEATIDASSSSSSSSSRESSWTASFRDWTRGWTGSSAAPSDTSGPSSDTSGPSESRLPSVTLADVIAWWRGKADDLAGGTAGGCRRHHGRRRRWRRGWRRRALGVRRREGLVRVSEEERGEDGGRGRTRGAAQDRREDGRVVQEHRGAVGGRGGVTVHQRAAGEKIGRLQFFGTIGHFRTFSRITRDAQRATYLIVSFLIGAGRRGAEQAARHPSRGSPPISDSTLTRTRLAAAAGRARGVPPRVSSRREARPRI